jgi:hypothetical protein
MTKIKIEGILNKRQHLTYRKEAKKMPIALERILKAVESIEIKGTEEKIAEKWLGAFEGVVPEGMTSTEYIKTLRESCYEKF